MLFHGLLFFPPISATMTVSIQSHTIIRYRVSPKFVRTSRSCGPMLFTAEESAGTGSVLLSIVNEKLEYITGVTFSANPEDQLVYTHLGMCDIRGVAAYAVVHDSTIY